MIHEVRSQWIIHDGRFFIRINGNSLSESRCVLTIACDVKQALAIIPEPDVSRPLADLLSALISRL
jgi:hypothetical protein